jgi:hypothetical protein
MYDTLHARCPQVLQIPTFRAEIDLACSCLNLVNRLCGDDLTSAVIILQTEIRPFTQTHKKCLFSPQVEKLGDLTKRVCLLLTSPISSVMSARGEICDIVADIIGSTVLRFEIQETFRAKLESQEARSLLFTLNDNEKEKEIRQCNVTSAACTGSTVTATSDFDDDGGGGNDEIFQLVDGNVAPRSVSFQEISSFPFTFPSISSIFSFGINRFNSPSTSTSIAQINEAEAEDAAVSISLRILQLNDIQGRGGKLNAKLAAIITTTRKSNSRFDSLLLAAESKLKTQ